MRSVVRRDVDGHHSDCFYSSESNAPNMALLAVCQGKCQKCPRKSTSLKHVAQFNAQLFRADERGAPNKLIGVAQKELHEIDGFEGFREIALL